MANLTCNIDRKIRTGQWILAAPTASWCRRDVHNQVAAACHFERQKKYLAVTVGQLAIDQHRFWPPESACNICRRFDEPKIRLSRCWCASHYSRIEPAELTAALQWHETNFPSTGILFFFPPHISLPPDGWRSIRTVSRRNGAQPSKKKKNTSSEAHTRADFMAHEIKQPAEYIWGGRLRLPATWHWLNYSGHAKGLRTAHTHTHKMAHPQDFSTTDAVGASTTSRSTAS